MGKYFSGFGNVILSELSKLHDEWCKGNSAMDNGLCPISGKVTGYNFEYNKDNELIYETHCKNCIVKGFIEWICEYEDDRK